MSEEIPAKSSSSGTLWMTVCIVALVAYLLSPGLMLASVWRWHWVSAEKMEKPFAFLYTPIVLACKWDPVGNFYSAYLTFCAGEPVNAHTP